MNLKEKILFINTKHKKNLAAMRTVKTKVYKFSELSKTAQQKVIQDNYDINDDYDWWDQVYDGAQEVGIEIQGFDLGRGQDINIGFTYDSIDTAKRIIEEHGKTCNTYKVASAFLQAIQVKRVAIALVGDDDERADQWDEDCEELQDEFKKDISRCYWKILDEEYDYLQSDEAIADTLINSEYEYTKDGEKIEHPKKRAA